MLGLYQEKAMDSKRPARLSPSKVSSNSFAQRESCRYKNRPTTFPAGDQSPRKPATIGQNTTTVKNFGTRLTLARPKNQPNKVSRSYVRMLSANQATPTTEPNRHLQKRFS
jgi:hypothetical protein